MADITRLTPRAEWPEFFRMEEFTALLDVSKGTGYSMVQSGAIEVVRCGRLIRVPRTVVERLLRTDGNGNGR